MIAIKKLKLILSIIAVIAVIGVLIWLHLLGWVLLGLLVLIVVLLHFSLRVHVHAGREQGIDITAKYLFFTLYPRKKKAAPQQEDAPPDYEFDEDLDDDFDDISDDDLPELPDELKNDEEEEEEEKSKAEEKAEDKKERRRRQHKGKKDSSDDDDGEGEKRGLAAIREKFEMVRPYIPIGWKAVKKFCKAIRFDGVFARVEVGRFDAHEAAIYYGAVQSVLFNTLGWLANIFTVRMKKAEVNCHFNENIIDGEVDFTVKARPSTLIAIAFCTGVNFLITFLKQRRARKKREKEKKEHPSTETEQAMA